MISLKDRYIIKCFGPDETRYYLQNIGELLLTKDPNKALVYKTKGMALSLCDLNKNKTEWYIPGSKIKPINWSIDIVKSYIEGD